MGARRAVGILWGLAWLVAILPAAVVWAANDAGIRLEHYRKKEVQNCPVKNESGTLLISLKTAVDFFGGETSWQGTTRKVEVKGTAGKTALLTMDVPRMLVDQKRFERLPHLPRLRKGQVLISPESLVVLWTCIGAEPPVYDAQNNVLRIGEGTTAPAGEEKTGQPQSQPKQEKQSPIVVVDAGHGGKDPGAIGPSKLKEKTVTLEVAQQLADQLKKRGYQVVMTRDSDVFITLKERAEIANRIKADLFISVHANASRNRNAKGSQVFIYNREATSENAAEAARLENQDANYLEIIKDDLRQGVHESSSINASGFVSQELEKLGLATRRIERAPFYVLAKSHMPSILIETAFISNKDEEQKLRSRNFCKMLAEGIDRGISQYYLEKNNTRR